MFSKSYQVQKQEITRSGSGILNILIRSTFNIKRVCIIICHLTLFGKVFHPASTSLIDIVYLLLRTGLELEGEEGVWVAKENLLSVMKVVY